MIWFQLFLGIDYYIWMHRIVTIFEKSDQFQSKWFNWINIYIKNIIRVTNIIIYRIIESILHFPGEDSLITDFHSIVPLSIKLDDLIFNSEMWRQKNQFVWDIFVAGASTKNNSVC